MVGEGLGNRVGGVDAWRVISHVYGVQVKDKGDQGYRVPNVFGHSRRCGYCRRGGQVGTEVVWPVSMGPP